MTEHHTRPGYWYCTNSDTNDRELLQENVYVLTLH